LKGTETTETKQTITSKWVFFSLCIAKDEVAEKKGRQGDRNSHFFASYSRRADIMSKTQNSKDISPKFVFDVCNAQRFVEPDKQHVEKKRKSPLF